MLYRCYNAEKSDVRKLIALKILLIHPPWLRFFGSCLPVPPLPLDYIAASVRERLPEMEIEIYNADFAPNLVPPVANDLFTAGHERYRARLHDDNDPVWKEIRQQIIDYAPDLVGVSAMTASFPSAVQILKIAKEVNPQIVTVLGGRHPTALPELSLKSAPADFVVVGDGEETFCDLLENLDSPEQVTGIAYSDNNGKIVINPPRVRKIAIDDYPLPVFESKLQRYGFEDRSKSEFFTWSVLSARGCPFQCVYCATEHQVRFRSIENVMQEIRLMKNRYGITHFCFEDDTFSLRADRLKQLCAALAAENVKWSCVTRVDTLTEELVQIMQKSGCTQVFLGIETGSAKTLERIRKKISLEQVETALNLFKRHGIPAMGFFIIGFHWETFADMKATVDLIKRLPLDSFQINIATPLPGTALFHELTESGRLNPEKIDWSQFHQGSYNMNFSDFPQQHWEKMLEHLQKRAFSLLKKKVIRLNLRRLLSDPKFIVKKLWNRFKANPRLLNWFVESKKAVTESQGSAHE